MENILRFLRDRLTLCDSGAKLNKLMHAFLFVTLAFSIGFLFFEHTTSVQAFVLYQESLRFNGVVHLWGIVGLLVVVFHTLAFLIRGPIGVTIMMGVIFGGVFLWVYAGILYLATDYFFQFLVICLPNLYFWIWYYFEWNKRHRGEEVAFV